MLKEMLMTGLLPLVLSFAVVAAIGPIFIPWLHKLKFGQEIRDEGPKWHQKKSGTPTMGGIMFIIGTAVGILGTFLVAFFADTISVSSKKSLLMLFIAVGFGAIGFIDDFIKVVKKRNLGLKAMPKFMFQMAFSVIYLAVLNYMGELKCEFIIPFINMTVQIPMWLYVIFALLVVTGTVNAVNLTDGLDGLASSVTIPIVICFALCALRRGDNGIFTFGFAVAGGLFGFLIYNKYPAKVFMGDTGSLFLGGAVVVMAIALEMHLFLIIAGFIYFAEALSVILQVASFKTTGKRIFKMSPIHHHFEMCGWKEVKIVAVFTVITIVLCVVTYLSTAA